MSGVVWSKFYWSDWSDDKALKLCSLAAQGLWMRLLCIAAEAEPMGHVAVNGKPLTPPEMAEIVGKPLTEIEPLLAELKARGVCAVFRGRIISKRMVKDARKSAEAKVNGALGGNPSLGNAKGKPQPLNPQDKPKVKRRLKTQEPRTRSKVEAPYSASNLTWRESADAGAVGASPPRAWKPDDVVEAFTRDFAADWLDSYFWPCSWQDVPVRALVAANGFAAAKIQREARQTLAGLNIQVLEKAA